MNLDDSAPAVHQNTGIMTNIEIPMSKEFPNVE
jgi:hypothetical protein